MKKSALGSIEFTPNQVVGQSKEGVSIFSHEEPQLNEAPIKAVAVLGAMSVDDNGIPMHTRDALFYDPASDQYGKFNLGASPLTPASVYMAIRSNQFEAVEPFDFPEPDHSRVHVVLAMKSPCLITTDSDKAFKAQSNLGLDPCVSLEKVREQLRPSSLVRILDDDAWPAIANEMLTQAKSAPNRQLVFEHTPKDLPAGLAQQRLFALEPFLEHRPENTETVLELMEILMADRNNRSLNWDLIRQSSMEGPWFSDNHEIDVDDLEAEIDSLHDEYHRLVVESPTPGATTDTDVAITQNMIAMSEKQFAFDRHPDNAEGLRLA
jgi:hypothetical protein